MPDALTDEGFLVRLMSWAQARDDVRACVLTSSRASDGAPLDEFSDFDVVLAVVPSAEEFTSSDAWIREIHHRPIVTHRSDYPDGTVMRLVLYADCTKADFAVVTAGVVPTFADAGLPPAWDLGWRALVDKDGLTLELPGPTYRAHVPMPPDQSAFFAVVEEFWWESTYVAKNLWRGDLMPARYNLEKVMIVDCLRTMLEWRIEIDHNWQLRPGALGRHLRQRLPRSTYRRLTDCFAEGTVPATWSALWSATSLFRDTAREVADSLGLDYPDHVEDAVTSHLRRVAVRSDGPGGPAVEPVNRRGRRADQALRLLQSLAEIRDGGEIDELAHALQTATRAMRDGADDELVLAALFHDVGKVFGDAGHAAISADFLEYHVRADVAAVVRFHGDFTASHWEKLAPRDDPRTQHEGRPWYALAEHFVDAWDMQSFDAGYPSLPLEHFRPLVYRLVSDQ